MDECMSTQKEYLEQVERLLEKKIQEINAQLEEGEKDIESMHDYYWENYTEMDEFGYENFDNQQALLHQLNSNQETFELKWRLQKMQDSPYFGRVDFQYDGDEWSEPHYIGIANLAERDGAVPLVFDWRAPVSSLFYDFEKGDASYEAPRGVIEGEITSKWQYKIRHGEMIYAVESDFKIDDDILREELSSNGDIQLKNIVRTIQKEQNQIIRNTKDRILVVQGAAGSGKTSIALHRIAYLLYHDRKKLKAKDVLILSPNRVFSNYISHILPELGEESIREMSFDYFAWKELKGIAADCEDVYDFIEKQLVLEESDANKAWKQLVCKKQTKQYAEEIRGFILMQEDELVDIKDFRYKKIQKTAAELNELFYFKFPDIPLLARMDAVMEYVVDEAETLFGKNFQDDELVKIKEKFDRMYLTKDVYQIYNSFLESQGLEPLKAVDVNHRMIPYEDVYPILFMKYLLYGAGKQHRIKHLVIDEMQDYSYIQYLILAQLFPCKMTIVGDRLQTMGEQARDVMTFLPSVLGKEIKMLEINKSYRNPIEIAEYAKALVGDTTTEVFGREGGTFIAETIKEADDGICYILNHVYTENCYSETCHKKNVEASKKRLFETAAVICMTLEESILVYHALKKKIEEETAFAGMQIHFIDRDCEKFEAGLSVVPFYLAKGLEFDQVFSWYKKQEQKPIHLQAKYIMATRALHELYRLELE